MTPAALDASSFRLYPPLAARLAEDCLPLLRRLPLAVLPSILEHVIAFDWKFPAERDQLSAQLEGLQAMDARSFRKLEEPFAQIPLPPRLADFDWLNRPGEFVQLLTPYLWSSRRIDAYRAAATALFDALPSRSADSDGAPPRIVIFVAGPELTAGGYPLFTKLRPHGLLCTNMSITAGQDWPAEFVARRAAAHRGQPYAHWYLDGGKPSWNHGAEITAISYAGLEPIRRAVLAAMARALHSGEGPEQLHRRMAAMRPADCGAPAITTDPVLQHFMVDLFTQGSGTQVYSTAFLQWAAREILRRAQPRTLLVRAAARVRQRDLNDLIEGRGAEKDLDPAGSAIDVDLAAYYTWLELRKLPGGERSTFLVWFQGAGQAFIAAPSLPANVSSASALTIEQLLNMALPG